MATQIASAMKYVEALGVVHGALSASSCLVDHGFTVKLADFGAAVDVYAAALRGGNRRETALPVRWMAWESVVTVRRCLCFDVVGRGAILLVRCWRSAHLPSVGLELVGWYIIKSVTCSKCDARSTS